MSGPLLQVMQASKSYGSFEALRGATFYVRPGELLGMLGPNGAGKTTLIRAICGRHQLDSGTILLRERPMDRAQRARLGFVPQDLAIYPDLTAEQNLMVFGRLHGVRGEQLIRRVQEALQWTRLADRRHSFAGTFSGGMQRRLNIACGVLHDPILLLLDEPTVGVDPQSRERIFDMLNELTRRGTSVLLTTHQLDEVQTRCDRIVIIDQGKVVASGELEELISQTVGHARQLTLQTRPNAEARRSSTQTMELPNVARDLPRVLSRAESKGIHIDHLTVKAPSLQDVFLHLTGKELRE